MSEDIRHDEAPVSPVEGASGSEQEEGKARQATLWRRFRSRWWGRWLIDGLLFLAIFLGVTAFQGRHLIGGGEAAPAFELKDMSGQVHTLEAYRGKQVLLVFWAPWCGVCKVESSNISAIHQAKDEGVQVLSVVVGYDGLDTVKAFMDEHEVDYPVLLGNRDIADAYAVNKFPTLYIVGEDGQIDHAEVGYTTTLGLKWRLLF